MIEKMVLDFLNSKLNVVVCIEVPEEPFEELVLIEKTGSSENDTLKDSTFVFQSYSSSLYKAALLNEEVKKQVKSLIELEEIIKVKLNTDYNFTDVQTKKYRYQAVFDMKHY